MKEENINISEIFEALKKRYKLIIGITLAFTIIATVLSFFVIKPKYEITTKLFIGKEINQSQKQQYDNNDVMMYQKLLTTYAEVIQTDDLIQRGLNKGHLNLEVKDIKSGLKVTPRADTQILEISYTGTDKLQGVNIVKDITDEFIKESNKLIPNGNVQVIEEAKMPENPVSPNKKLNILIAFVLGIMVSVGLSLLLEFMDNTYKSKEDVENYLDIPVIGVIPEFDEENVAKRRGKH